LIKVSAIIRYAINDVKGVNGAIFNMYELQSFIFRFAEFTEQIEVDSAISSDGFVYDPPTPDFVKSHARIRKIEFYLKRFFVRPSSTEY